MTPGTYARFSTTEGEFTVRLFEDRAPLTVANFTGLAEGTKDPATGKPGQAKPFYDGLIFHRIIEGFMIQGGDPQGNGRGGPGYTFADEFDPKVGFDRPGLLAMANRGPNTNGSQFFITLAPTEWLDGKHTIFGEVVEGLDIVLKIGSVRTGPGDRPVTPVVTQARHRSRHRVAGGRTGPACAPQRAEPRLSWLQCWHVVAAEARRWNVGQALSRFAYLMVVQRGDHERYRFLSSTFRDRPVEVDVGPPDRGPPPDQRRPRVRAPRRRSAHPPARQLGRLSASSSPGANWTRKGSRPACARLRRLPRCSASFGGQPGQELLWPGWCPTE